MISLPKLFTAALASTSVVIAAATPQQVSDGLKVLTQKAHALQAPAQSISIVNAPLIVIGQGPFPQIIGGFSDIISTATTLARQMSPAETQKVRHRQRNLRDDVDLIFNSFKDFVRINEAILTILLIEKVGVLKKVPLVGGPVAAVLRRFENIVDLIAITLINTLDTRVADFTSEANSLQATLTKTIEKYEGVEV